MFELYLLHKLMLLHIYVIIVNTQNLNLFFFSINFLALICILYDNSHTTFSMTFL
jgi:hypothetical protein